MAHEFNNPLGIVMGFTQELLNECEPDSRNYQALKIIDEETRRCQRIIQELLQFARPRNTEFALTDIKQLLDKCVNLVANRLYKQSITSSMAIDENLPRISADSQQLEQVVVNLLLNAIDAMPKGGRLAVEATLTTYDGCAPLVAIAVEDNGAGIDEAHLAKIFQPFFSAKKSKGIGLGLSICERIVQNHGGRILVESSPGKGSRFSIQLPLEYKQGKANATLASGMISESEV
jgi:signal transduction histidine kinase